MIAPRTISSSMLRLRRVVIYLIGDTLRVGTSALVNLFD